MRPPDAPPVKPIRPWRRDLLFLLGFVLVALIGLAVVLRPAPQGENDPVPRAPASDAALAGLFDTLDAEGSLVALEQAKAMGNSPAVAYLTWRQVLDGQGTAEQRLVYTLKNPHLPALQQIARAILQADIVDLPPQQRLDMWAQVDDGSLGTQFVQFEALAALNLRGALREELATLWRAGEPMAQNRHRQLLDSYGDLLTPEDHVTRLNALMNQSAVGPGLPRAELTRAAGLMRALVPEPLNLVRIAWARGGEADRANVPQALRQHAALVSYEVWENQETAPLYASAVFRTIDPATARPEALWRLRKVLIRNSIREGVFGEAYELAATHGLGASTEGQIAELMAGWIVLSYTKLPGLALQHYDQVLTTAPGPWIASKALRGRARALALLGRRGEARRALQDCARFETTLYALLCLEDLGEPLPAPVQFSQTPSSAQPPGRTENFSSLYDITALLVALERPEKEVYPFARAAFGQVGSAQDLHDLAQVLQSRDDLPLTRTAGPMAHLGTLRFYGPALPQLSLSLERQHGIEPALSQAIIAQESGFRPKARSPIGAVGLMQLRPSTALEVAQRLGKPDLAQDLTDPQANVELGNAYLAQLLAQYDGALLLAIAAYNAGPGTVNQWLTDFGDPRSGTIRGEDWLDALSIAETRTYVQRVLTNLYIYRAVLSADDVEIDLQSVMLGQ